MTVRKPKKAGKWLKDHFIPHAGNEYRPHMLRPRTVAFVFLVVAVAETAFFLSATYVVPRSKFFGIIQATALVDETNQQREANNLPALQDNPLLTAAAQEKANDMVANNYFAHTSPQGVTPWYWFEQVGYNFSFAGENLAVNFSDSQDVTNAWMNSPEHRANILNAAFTQIGMASAQGTYNGQPAIYVVELFGTPAEAPVAYVNTAGPTPVPVSAPVAAATVLGSVLNTTTTAPAAAPAARTTSTKPASSPAKVAIASKPAAKPVAIAKTTPVPVIVSTTAQAAAPAQIFVAVKGIETQATGAVPAIVATSPSPAIVVMPPAGASSATQPAVQQTQQAAAAAPQANWFQRIVSNPKSLANDFYFAVMLIFLVALILNIFVNIQVQFPRLIVGGLVVIVAAGLCIMLNQNIGLFHATIL